MRNNIKTILISQFPLPYDKIGSWTTMYNNYISSNNNKIDIIICPTPQKRYTDITYFCYDQKRTFLDRVKQKLQIGSKWSFIHKTLKKVIFSDSKYIIQIVDNYGLTLDLINFLEQNNLREKCYIQFFYHGFKSFNNEYLYNKVNEIILLTHKSYQDVKNNTNSFPCHFSVLHNGIDTSKFHSVSSEEKNSLKKDFNVSDKKIFVWCSQDRPKKGLFLILDVWKNIYKKHKNIELWVIGTEKKQDLEGVKFIGRIPNVNLPKYYQTADVYLFPTLCQEGFGLSLTEALHCGCYCIASDLGGVPEVLQYGNLGKLIKNPNFQEEWEQAILEFIDGKITVPNISKNIYTMESWNSNMNTIIDNAKKNLK